MPRDWAKERKDLAEAFTQLEIMKLWLMDHAAVCQVFIEEFKRLNKRLGKLGQIDEEGMIHFSLGIDQDRWKDFTEACSAGQELSPAEIERKAFYLWIDTIDTIIEHYKSDNEGPATLAIWIKEKELPDTGEIRVVEIADPPRKQENDGPALML